MVNKLFLFIVVLGVCLRYCKSYEPLNLKLPADYEVPTETFTLCDLNQEYLRNYCLNKGICYTLINSRNKPPRKEAVKPHANSIVSADIFCSCTNEFTGTRCEVPIGLAVQQVNKTSIPVYKIDVKEYGQKLPLPRHCPPTFECFNGGTCMFDILTGAKCLCQPGFVGDHCNQIEYCSGVRNCRLRCDFGYKRDAHGCEQCACNCVNEENYFDEIKNAFRVSMVNESSQFCRKPCKLGYVKDQFNCFRCECVEDALEKALRPTTTTTAPSQIIPERVDDYCATIKCNPNETCKYFDRNFYSCPEEMINCKEIERLSKIPVCIPNSYPEPCTESLKVGNCDQFAERYYFDVIDKRCKKFFYSGCLGNRNNFASLQQCSLACGEQVYSNDDHHSWYLNRTNSIVHSLKMLFNTTRPLTTRPSSPLQPVTTPASAGFKTISIPNINFNQLENNLTKTTNLSESGQPAATNACRWVCGLNCPFGYKLDQRTKCYKCECIELNMTECGVPCFLPGTKSCLYSMRANSRPKCLCSPEYDGVYCQTYLQYFNFSVRVEKSFKLNAAISDEIKTNLSQTIGSQLEISSNLVIVNDLKNHLKDNSLIIRFSLNAPDFSTADSFYRLVENLHALIDRKNLTVRIFDQDFVVQPNCEKSEELFSMDMNDRFLAHPNQLKAMIRRLKDEIDLNYKLQPQTMSLVKIKIEPTLQLEFLIKNNINDPEFCKKAYNLQNDIRTKFFLIDKFVHKYSELAVGASTNEYVIGSSGAGGGFHETKKLFDDEDENSNGSPDTLNSESNVFVSSRNANSFSNRIRHFKQSGGAAAATASIRSHRIVFVSVIVSSFLLLVFLVCLVIIMQLKLNQAKNGHALEKLDESSICKDNPKTPEIPKEKNASDMPGYFMPNYSTIPRDFSTELPLNPSLKKVNVISY